MLFRPILASTPTRPESEYKWVGKFQGLSNLLALSVSLPTLLAIGAFAQTLLVLAIPRFYALAPSVVFLAARLVNTVLITYGWTRNHYLDGVIFKKAAALVPDTDGVFSDEPANEGVTILLLGAKSNHPMSAFAPGFSDLGEHLQAMSQAMDRAAPTNGFLGQTNWMNRDKNGAIQVNVISYWRSIDDLHIFAHSPVHREGWVWWEKTLKQHDHLGINHEIFSAPKGQWENIYANFQPTGLGATSYLRRGNKLEGGVVGDQWISPLIEANTGKLRTSAGRLGWKPETVDRLAHEKYGGNVYEQ